jgi:hypothetical protein
MDCDAYREDMMDLLYGEGGDEPARRLEAHQATCADCRRELAGLRRLRADLAQWRLPEALRASAAARTPSRRFPIGLAAAAVVVLGFAATLAVAGVELRRDQGGFALRVGRPGDPRVLADMERRHREEIAALRAELVAARRPDQREILATVADMIHDSERRQEEARIDGVRLLRQRTEAQRQYDLARMSAGLAYLDGKTGLQAARTTELVGHILQASQQK